MSFLYNEGVSATAIRTFAWEETALGPMAGWPPMLQHLLPVMLASAGPKLLLWGPDLITFHNDAYLPLLGKIGGGIGKPYRELRKDLWPAVGPSIEAALCGTGSLLNNVALTSWRNGFPEQAYSTLCYTPVAAEPGHVVGVLVDIHDTSLEVRTRAELRDENERLYRLFVHSPFLMAIGSVPDFRFEFANPAFAAFYGNRPLVGRTVAEALPEAVEQGFLALLEQVAQTRKPWVGRNIELYVTDVSTGAPERRYVDFIYQPVLNEAGVTTSMICFGNDVTDHQLDRERADQLHAQLLHTSRVNAMGTMAMTLAHEINQPLTAAANFLSAARRLSEPEAINDDARSALAQSESQIQRAGQIIRRIRNMVAAGNPKREVVEVHGAVMRSTALLQVSGDVGEVALELSIERGAEQVLADQIQLEQILLNLLRNAEEASDGASPARVEVSAVLRDGSVRITVRDHGSGIDPARAETLFEALQPSSSGGLGVGLSLCRTMVEAHGGRIWAESAATGGTAISFTLPRSG